ncbi:unnamed protein product [Scytosiphon promiscuus]
MASSTSTHAPIKTDDYERSLFRWVLDKHPAPFDKHGITVQTLERTPLAREAFYNSDWPGARALVERKEDESAMSTASHDSSFAPYRYCRTTFFQRIIERGLREGTRFSVEHITSCEKAKLGIAKDDTCGNYYYLRVYGDPSPSASSKRVSDHQAQPEKVAKGERAEARLDMGPWKTAGLKANSAKPSEQADGLEEERGATWPSADSNVSSSAFRHNPIVQYNYERSLYQWVLGRRPAPRMKQKITGRVLDQARLARQVFYRSDWPGARILVERHKTYQNQYCRTALFERIIERGLREGTSFSVEHLTRDEMAKLGIAWDGTAGKHYLSVYGGPSPSASSRRVSDNQAPSDTTSTGESGAPPPDASPWQTADFEAPVSDKRMPYLQQGEAVTGSLAYGVAGQRGGGEASSAGEGGQDVKTSRLPGAPETPLTDGNSLQFSSIASTQSFSQDEPPENPLPAGGYKFGGTDTSPLIPTSKSLTPSSAGGSAKEIARGTEERMKRQKRTGPESHQGSFSAAWAGPDSRQTQLEMDVMDVTLNAPFGGIPPSSIESPDLQEGGIDLSGCEIVEESTRTSATLVAQKPDEATLQADILTRFLETGPAVYVSKTHEVELELQEKSLEEAIPLPVTITPSVKFVACGTGGTCRAPFRDGSHSEEFVAMTFVHGPEEATFRSDRPAKLRFFMGFADEFASSETPDEVVTDETIERHIVESYRPLTSPDGESNWAVLGLYSVVFRLVNGRREIWAETPLNHFCEVAHGVKISIKGYDDLKHGDTSYYYGNIGGFLTRRLQGTSPTPKVRFGNATKEFATFTSYPIVEHTDIASERGIHAEIGAAGGSVGGGRQTQSSVSGFALSAAREPQTTVVRPGSYHDGELVCDIKAHLQMRVKVGILHGMKAGTNGMVNAKGSLQLLDSLPISGYKMLVLRQPRLETPSQYKPVDWPCTGDDIRAM